jgi:hypothetical protein
LLTPWRLAFDLPGKTFQVLVEKKRHPNPCCALVVQFSVRWLTKDSQSSTWLLALV